VRTVIGLLALIFPAFALAQATEAQARIYQLDLFSLISFGLAITALVVALFMSWLSWEFYKKSSQTSETTNETVTRIETSIAGIQSSISEIVQRAVGHWIDGNDGTNLTELKSELQSKLSDLEEKLSQAGTEGSPDVSPELAALKDQMLELSKGVRDVQMRALFPSLKEESSPIEVSQNRTTSEADLQEGQIIVTLKKPMKYATGTGKFIPRFAGVPTFEVNLVSSPYSKIEEVSFSHGVGKPTDFNIHLNGKGETLKSGDYVFNYKASYAV
jgi:hypothetical protein